LRGGVDHGVSTEGMHVYELYSGHRGTGENRAGDGVWNVVKFQVQEDARPSAAISRTACGPAAVNNWLPTLNMPTRSATCLANFSAVDNESKSRATIKLLRGWASKLTFLGQLHQLEPDLAHARVDKTEFPGDAIGYINSRPS